MAHKSKHDKFHFSFAIVIRLVIFFLFVYFSIVYFSTKNSPSLVLGQSVELKPVVDSMYEKIPPESREKIENLSSLPFIINVQKKIQDIQAETNGFPQKQILDIKKAVVQQIYDSIMKSIK